MCGVRARLDIGLGTGIARHRALRLALMRVLGVCAALASWLVAAPAFAAEASVVRLVSSAAVAPMSPRGEEPTHVAAETRAPLCDMRCATTFANAPALHDEELALAAGEDDDGPALDIAKLVPRGAIESVASVTEACMPAPPRVAPAPPSALFVPIAAEVRSGSAGVHTSVERPPRAA